MNIYTTMEEWLLTLVLVHILE